MKKLLLSILLISISTTAISQDKYKLGRVSISDQSSFEKLVSTGIDLEGAIGKVGDYYEIVISENDLPKLQNQGLQFTIQIEDLSKYYSQRLYKGSYNALGFGYGSMGGFYTYSEVLQQLDSMKIQFPALITTKQVIDTTIEGRLIYAVKISDNPDKNESNEPAVLYTALTHAREPQGMMNVLYYMWWLLENYGTNSEAAYLVDSRQIWFIPINNPDGYVYNQSTNPSGGGMWRKNRRNNGVSYGIDLNRNFGPYEYWNAPNGGSSTDPASDTYRGTAPFSEPETQNLRDFVIGKNFKACLNYHSYSNLLVYPYGALVHETPDSLIYREYARDMTAWNGYTYGTDQQTVGYSTRGNSDDFMYDGDVANNGKIFAMTPEVGSSGDYFWPSTGRILPLAQENLYPNIYLSNIAGNYPVLQQTNIVDSSGDGFVERGEQFYLKFTIRNKGLDLAHNVTLQLASSSPNILIPSSPIDLGTIGSVSNKIDSVHCAASPSAQSGVTVKIFATITEQTGRIIRDTIPVYIGKKIISLVFSDSASNGTGKWSLGTSWGLSSTNHTPSYSFTDSPSGQYSNYADNSMTLLTALNLSSAADVKLKFWTRWDLEAQWDFATVEASSNGGSTWNTLKGKYTKTGSGNGVQTPGTFGYDGTKSTWVEEEMDVTSYVSSNFKFRFRVRSDSYFTGDGFYVDDIRLLSIMPDTAKYRDITITPVSVSFGNVPVGQSRDTTINFSNLTSSDDNLTGTAHLTYSTQYNLSNGGSFVIPIGADYQFHLSFNPNTEGALNDTLVVEHNGTSTVSPIKIPLFGIGYEPPQFLRKIIITNSANADTLMFGEAAGATAGIDTLFGEKELTPISPPDSFDVRWEIPGTNGLSLDIRDTLGTSNPLNLFTCKIQSGISGYPIKIKWDSDSLHRGAFRLKDAETNGTLININMKNIDTVVISDTSVTKILIEHQHLPSANFTMNSGWNMVSLPYEVEDARKSVVFPTSISSAFAYRNYYVLCDTLKRHEGYWIKFNSSEQINLAGNEVLDDTIGVKEGWNLIGSISQPISVTNIVSEPPSIITSNVYGYNSGYEAVGVMAPAYGYWVKVKQDGKLFLKLIK